MKTLFTILVRNAVFSKYLVASAVALAMDVGTFLWLLDLGTDPTLSASISYTLGIFAHWILSSRLVFSLRVARAGRARTLQKTQFVLSALTGLCLTAAIVTFGSYLAIDPRLAKIAAIAVSFATVWHLRNRYIFKALTPSVMEP